MNNKEIEEMAHKLCKSKSPCTECLKRSRDNGVFINKEDCKFYLHAKILSKHYRKIDKDSVVLTETERITMCVEQWDKGYERGSKETAEKILKEVAKTCGDYQWFKNLCKQFKVEIKE